jgi:hypothetical protein
MRRTAKIGVVMLPLKRSSVRLREIVATIVKQARKLDQMRRCQLWELFIDNAPTLVPVRRRARTRRGRRASAGSSTITRVSE